MNDFTKEELEDFVSWGEVYTEFGNSWTDKNHRQLIEKVQEMIDNYEAKVIPAWHCEKCGHVQ